MLWLISGSRDFPDIDLAMAVFKTQFKPGDYVIHGGARGVDTWAGEVAKKKGCKVKIYHADWEKHGKSAGMIRNNYMLDVFINHKGPKRVLIVWDGESSGTGYMLRVVQRYGYPLTLIEAGLE